MALEAIFDIKVVIALIVTIAAIIVMRKLGITELLDNAVHDGLDYLTTEHGTIVLYLIVVICLVVLLFSVANVVDCVNTPTCYGWPIRAPPENLTNISTYLNPSVTLQGVLKGGK